MSDSFNRHDLPPGVVAGLGPDVLSASVVAEEPIGIGTGAATAGVTRLTIRLAGPHGSQQLTILQKRLAPLTAGKHAGGAMEPRHWAYWRREAEAYMAGFLPEGPGLRAPRCYAVIDDQLYLEEVKGGRPSVERAAAVLACWQQPQDEALDRPWLCMDQLAARVAVSHLDWAQVNADLRMQEPWNGRHELLARLEELPRVLSHGDYSLGNIIDTGGDVVALDWATLGWEPVGFDLAHLALSSGTDPTHAYLDAMPSSAAEPALVMRGYTIAVALIGSSRLHWMLSRNLEPPDWYTDFVWRHRPHPSA